MNNQKETLDVEVRNSLDREVDFAWDIYKKYVVENIFRSGARHVTMSDWKEDKEKEQFSSRWNSETCYTILIDSEVGGWISTEKSQDTLVVENIFVVEKYQKKGIARKIVSDMIPVWQEQKIMVEFPILKDAPLTQEAQKALSDLGFNLVSEDALTNIMRLDCR